MHRDIVRDSGILALSEKCDDIVMWSRYADEHHGICLGFDATHGLFSRCQTSEVFQCVNGHYANRRQTESSRGYLSYKSGTVGVRERMACNRCHEFWISVVPGCSVECNNSRMWFPKKIVGELKIGFHYEAEVQCCSKQSFEKAILEWTSCLVSLFTFPNRRITSALTRIA
jgi:hypothetical protein